VKTDEREFDADKGCITCAHAHGSRCRRLGEDLPMDGGYRCTHWAPVWVVAR